jgi:2-polyprenyl-6-methoxyphenol hydroxylase-like FAD-dependent oxidoreductase
MDYLKVPETKVPVTVKADVVVIGGGPAGVGAAVRAARGGAKTYLIERFGSLGGVMTNGYVSSVRKFGPLAMEIMTRLEEGGYTLDAQGTWPGLSICNISHNGKHHFNQPMGERQYSLHGYFVNFDPDMMSCVMNDICEEAGVNLSFRNSFVDCVVENGSIKAVLVENPGGRQAVEGKVFIDCTGRGDVVARAGSPYRSQGNDDGWGHMAAGLMYRMSGVDIERVLEYERGDPGLEWAMFKAMTKGEKPHYHAKRTEEWMKSIGTFYNGWHTGHPRLEMMPWLYDDDLMMWSIPPYDLKLNPSESVEDATVCEIQCRKEIREEIAFLKKYVPGFENAHLSGMAPMMGLREGRHPLGEYVYTWDDLKDARKFNDCVMRMTPHYPFPNAATSVVQSEYANPGKWVTLEFPKGVFEAAKIDNLLLAGDNMSIRWDIYCLLKGFGQAISTGECAGMMAARSVKTNTKVKDLKPEPFVVDFRFHPENQAKYDVDNVYINTQKA